MRDCLLSGVCHFVCACILINCYDAATQTCLQWSFAILQQINPSAFQEAFPLLTTTVKEMSVKLLSRHLKLQTRSIMTLVILKFGSMEVLFLSNFPQEEKSDLKISDITTK